MNRSFRLISSCVPLLKQQKCSIILWSLMALAVVASDADRALAAFIISHTGATDPTTEGFVGQTFAAPPSTTGPLANDQGHAAWSIAGSGQSSQFVYTSGQFTPAQIADIDSFGFELTFTSRAVQGLAPSYNNVNRVVISGAAIVAGERRFDVTLGLDGNGDTVVVLPTSVSTGAAGVIVAPGPSYTLVGSGSSYHTYRLVYDPITESADLYVDGVQRLSGYLGHTTNVVDRGLMWGAYSGGQGNFAHVQLRSLIPEPGSLLLTVLGLAGGLLVRHAR